MTDYFAGDDRSNHAPTVARDLDTAHRRAATTDLPAAGADSPARLRTSRRAT